MDAIIHLHKNVSKHQQVLSGQWFHCFKNNILERGIVHIILNSLLYLHKVHMKYVNAYEDLIRKPKSYIDAIHILATSYRSLILVPPSQLNIITT